MSLLGENITLSIGGAAAYQSRHRDSRSNEVAFLCLSNCGLTIISRRLVAFRDLRRRLFAYGFLSVVLGLYLDAIGLTTAAIGWIFTAALAGGAVMTIVITAVADTVGRKDLTDFGRHINGDCRLGFCC